MQTDLQYLFAIKNFCEYVNVCTMQILNFACDFDCSSTRFLGAGASKGENAFLRGKNQKNCQKLLFFCNFSLLTGESRGVQIIRLGSKFLYPPPPGAATGFQTSLNKIYNIFTHFKLAAGAKK